MKTITRILCAVAAVLSISACKQDEAEYLVRETDKIKFASSYQSSRKITLRCVGAWKTIVPEGSEWISTTPSEGVGNGQIDFINVNVDDNVSEEQRTAVIYLENAGKCYEITVIQAARILEGLPVSWEFLKTQGNDTNASALKDSKPEWGDGDHYVKSDDQGGLARILAVEAPEKSEYGANEVNGWAYNNGHIYIKGLYLNDYWLLTVPVKNLDEGKTINVKGVINGSGSSPAFFILEYSLDGETWAECDDPKEYTMNDKVVRYHVQAKDASSAEESGNFEATFTTPSALPDGNLYIRARVCANVRINHTSTITITTGGSGSTRLRGTWMVSVVE